jgi:two-component sensor histidine kinase
MALSTEGEEAGSLEQRRCSGRTRAAGRLLSLLVLILGAGVLVGGWMMDHRFLQQLRAGYALMVPSTAACFIAVGLAMLAFGHRPDRRAAIVQMLLAGGVVLVAVADLSIIAHGSFSGIDQFLAPTSALPADGYMSPATAICFALAALCLLLRDLRIPGQRGWYCGMASVGLFIAFVAVTGYAFDAVALYEVSLFTAMALHTALGFALVFLALHVLRPTWGWMRVVIGRFGGSATVRRLLPAVLLTPFLFSWVVLQATEQQLFSANFRLSLSAIASMALLGTLLMIDGARQNHAERRREQAFRELEIARQELERTASQRQLLLRELYHRVKNNLQVVEALMAMQSRSLDDERAKEAFFVTRQRVSTLALIHQQLLQSGDLSRIDLKDFLARLADNLAFTQGASERSIAVEVTADNIDIAIDFAIPLGLLVNEFVTNAFRHAFAANLGGTIRVSAVRDGDRLSLAIADDGHGGPADPRMNPANDPIGERIAHTLITQLGGTLEITQEHGRRVSMVIPLPTETSDLYRAAS